MQPQHQEQHEWLARLAGEWSVEIDAVGPAEQPCSVVNGTDSVRTFGNLWIICDGTHPMPEGGTGKTIMTLGYDPAKKKFVGTFIGTMMGNLWVYEGDWDASRTRLVLNAEGPSFTDPTKTTMYQDIIEIKSDSYRTLRSQFQGEDGSWNPFMTAHYRRKSA